MSLSLLDRTLPTLAENLALDEALLFQAEDGTGGEVLRFWEWPSIAVVLGAGGKRIDDVDDEACLRDRVPIQRRSSGGGTVLLGPGCLLFSLVLRFDRDPLLKDVNASYRYIIGRMIRALAPLAKVEMMGTSDLAIDGRKFSGNAQQRKRDHVLHHGTLLYEFDLPLLSRYLRTPEKQPAYREARPHGDFVGNLCFDAELLRRLIQSEWNVHDRASAVPAKRIAELLKVKYGQEEWVRRR